MRLNPKIVGRWAGTAIWLQWDVVLGESKQTFRAEIRLRKPGEEWGRWIPVEQRGTGWCVVPTWKDGWECEARVTRIEEGDVGWEFAKPAKFDRCECLFEFSNSGPRSVYYVAGTEFHCQVDGAACGYITMEGIEVGPGEAKNVTLVAVDISGYSQLDKPDHFLIHAGFGIKVRNIEPSKMDLVETGERTVVIENAESQTKLTLVVTPPTRY